METQTNQSPENIFDNAYRCFFELCIHKFLRASGIWWQYFSREGRSLHQDVIEDPEKAIEQLTEGKPQLLEKVLMDKFEDALTKWAIEKMGEDFEKYVGRGLELFFAGVMIKQMDHGVYTPEAASRTVIPLHCYQSSIPTKNRVRCDDRCDLS